MTTTMVAIIALALLATLGLSWWMLNRSWGDFPQRGSAPRVGASAPATPPQRAAPPPAFESDATNDVQKPLVQAGSAAGAANRILITHPMLLRAAESALYQNSAHARYLVRSGDQLFFAFDRIADPQQRAQAVDLMQRFQSGQHVDMGTVFQLLALLDKG